MKKIDEKLWLETVRNQIKYKKGRKTFMNIQLHK